MFGIARSQRVYFLVPQQGPLRVRRDAHGAETADCSPRARNPAYWHATERSLGEPLLSAMTS